MRKINKPIKFFGLSSGQFAIFMLLTAIIIIVSIFKQLHPILIIGIISAILFLSGLLFQTLKKEHKAGNPDYLTGLRIKNATPRHIPANLCAVPADCSAVYPADRDRGEGQIRGSGKCLAYPDHHGERRHQRER